MSKDRRNGGGTAQKGNGSQDREERSPPIFSRRKWTGSANVEVAVFDKMIEGEGGEFRVFTVVAKRSWKDGDEYKSGNYFRPEDLLILALFLQEAASFIAQEEAKR